MAIVSAKPGQMRKAHPVVPGWSKSRAGGSNPKRGWVRVFREVLIRLPACRLQSFGAAAGAGLSARLCGDCRARRVRNHAWARLAPSPDELLGYRDVPIEAPIVSEDKLVEIRVDMFAAQAVIRAKSPPLH